MGTFEADRCPTLPPKDRSEGYGLHPYMSEKSESPNQYRLRVADRLVSAISEESGSESVPIPEWDRMTAVKSGRRPTNVPGWDTSALVAVVREVQDSSG